MSPYDRLCPRKRCAQRPHCQHAKPHQYDAALCETVRGYVTGRVVCPACEKVKCNG